MRKFAAWLLAASLLLLPAAALADDCEITAQGTAVVTADPDIVSVTARAEFTADTVAKAQEKMGGVIAAVTDGLLALGVAEEDIITENYSYSPTYDYSGSTPKLTGYEASHTLSITCRDVDLLDAVIGALTDGGMTQIYNVSYDSSKGSELYRDALELAIQAAQEKAQRMAKPLGLTIVAPESVTELGGGNYAVYSNAKADLAEASAAGIETGIRSGSVSVSASVTVVFEAR